MPFGSHFACVQSHLKKQDFLRLKGNWKNLIVQSSFYLQFKSKARLKFCILNLNFVIDLAQVGKYGTLLLQYLAVNKKPLVKVGCNSK